MSHVLGIVVLCDLWVYSYFTLGFAQYGFASYLFFQELFVFFLLSLLTMSIAADVSALLAEAAGDSGITHEQIVERALQEVERLIAASGQSLNDICREAEAASDKDQLREILRRFTRIVRVLLEAAPGPQLDPLVCKALISLRVSDRLAAILSTDVLVPGAVTV